MHYTVLFAHGFPVLFGWPYTIYCLSIAAIVAAFVCRRGSLIWLALASVALLIGGLYFLRLAWGVVQDRFIIDYYVLELAAFGLPPVVLGGISLYRWLHVRS